ncbi:D-glycero-beta-D-manno-heptose-7-phosphate kinase [Singulisphaera sp. PoT]|uniref:D-glycero-beta-D-manno-heptose-7-phosphate kinase n=1 Tax=Singulisphaera sp. PoT TaxID=3411797 RepID=UPI003BF52262
MFRAPEDVSHAIESQFGGKRVLVVGDLMVDAYLWGDVSRISPEAPVPVVRLNRKTVTLGGAGNVLLNLVGLGLPATAAGFVGDDDGGRQLGQMLEQAGISSAGCVRLADRPTTTKTRVVSGHHQMLRLDEEGVGPVADEGVKRLIDAILGQLDDASALILSDYAKGVVTAEVCQAIIPEARRRGIPVIVDPKGFNFQKYAGATTMTPNLREFEIATGLEAGYDSETFQRAGSDLRERLGLEYLVVTCGDKGIRLFDKAGWSQFPALAREVYDVSGAGDTVIASLTASIVAGLDLDDAMRLANVAAGVVVGKIGTTPIQSRDLRDAVRDTQLLEQPRKVYEAAELADLIQSWKSRGDRVVFTNGCFDLLHVGHVTLLAKARACGDRLVVGLNTDRSVRQLKGPTRPVVVQGDRAQVLAGLASVDAVVLFDEETPLELIAGLKPDVLVKGGDYEESQVVGGELVKSWGGRVAIIPLVEGRSTTKLLEKSQKDPNGNRRAG